MCRPRWSVKGPTDKLFSLGGRIVWGAAGDVGLTQVVADALNREVGADRSKCSMGIGKLRPLIRGIVQKQLREAHDRFVPSGSRTAWQGNAFLFAGVTGAPEEPPWILEVGDSAQDVIQGTSAAIGSADVFAYFATGMMAHLPQPAGGAIAGQVIVQRTIASACNTAAFGISLPVKLWYADRSGTHELNQTELEAIQHTVGIWLDLEADLLPQVATPSDL